MQRKFVASLILLLAVNFLVKPLWIFAIDLQVQNRLGAEAYGLYAALFSFSIVFNIILDLGLSHYSNRRVAQDAGQVREQFSSLLSLKLLLGGVYLVIALIAGIFLGYWHSAFGLLLLLVVNQFFSSATLFFRAHLAGLHLFKADALMSVLDKMLVILLCGAVLYIPSLKDKLSIELFAGLQTVSFFLAATVGLGLVLRQGGALRLSGDFPYWWRQLSASFPYALLLLLMALYTRIDSVMLEQLRSSFQAGVYAQAYRLLDVINQPAYLFSVILLPMFARTSRGATDLRELSRLAFSLILVFTLSVAMAGYGSADFLMDSLYTAQREVSSGVFKLLIFSSLGFGITYIYGTLLTAQGRMRQLNATAVSGLLINVLLNLLLIPQYGAAGAALATVVTQSGTALVQLALALRINDMAYGTTFWWRVLGFGTSALMTTWLGSQMSYLPGLSLFLATGGAVVIWGWVWGLLPLQAGLRVVRERLRSGGD